MGSIKRCKNCLREYKNKNKVFCSNKCKFIWHRKYFQGFKRKELKKKVRYCKVCGKPFYFYPSEEKRKPCSYCSKECWHKVRQQKIKGPNSPLWKEKKKSSTFRKWAKSILPNKCFNCGWDEGPCDVCHIIPRREGGEDRIENIIILCPNCHRLFDLKKLDLKVQPFSVLFDNGEWVLQGGLYGLM